MHKSKFPTSFTLFITTLFVFIVVTTSGLADSKKTDWHEWKVGTQTSGGHTVACSLGLDSLTFDSFTSGSKDFNSTLIMTTLSLLIVEKSDKKVLSFLVKIVGERILDDLKTQAIPIYYAWVKSSTGSTVNQITQLETKPEKYFLGGMHGNEGMALFVKILRGIVEDGLVIGWQESPGKFDKVISIKDPPPEEELLSFLSCLENQKKEYLSQ